MPSLYEDIEAAVDERLRELQLDLLTTSAIIEQRIRSWHPGAEWTKEDLAALEAAQQQQGDITALLVDLLRTRIEAGSQEKNSPTSVNDSLILEGARSRP